MVTFKLPTNQELETVTEVFNIVNCSYHFVRLAAASAKALITDGWIAVIDRHNLRSEAESG